MPLKYLIIPADARADVDALLSLSGAQLRTLDHALSDKESLKGERWTYRRIAAEIGVSPEAALGILNAVDNLRRQREQFEISDSAILEDLATIHPVEEPDARGALTDLLRKSDEDYFVEKVSSLRHAVVPHVTDVRTVVDARPVFSRDRDRIEGLLLLTYLESFHRERLTPGVDAALDAEIERLENLASTHIRARANVDIDRVSEG